MWFQHEHENEIMVAGARGVTYISIRYGYLSLSFDIPHDRTITCKVEKISRPGKFSYLRCFEVSVKR